MSIRRVNMRAIKCSCAILLASLVALLASPSGAFLVNYQSANLGLLPNGYNTAASNLASNQQQDTNPYSMNPNEQTAIQQQSQDQYATNQGQIPTQNGPNYPMPPQYQTNKNNLQQQQQSLNGITERDAQTPIFRLQGSALNSTSVKLFWSLESDYVARMFEIKYGPIPDHEKFSQPLNGTARDATISSLQPDTLYGFTLTGYPAEGSGSIWRPRYFSIKTPRLNEQSSQAARQLVEDGSITPLGVKAEAKSNQTIQLTWTEQERPVNVQNLKRFNIIRYYVVNDNTQTNTDQQQQQQQQPATDQTNSSLPAIKYHYLNVSEDKIRGNGVVIQKLQPATEYAFAVKTAYVAPDTKKIYRHSGYSMDTSAKTFDLEPSPPRNFDVHPDLAARNESEASKTSTNIKLTWTPPESPNGRLRGYVILWTLNLAEKKWDEIQVTDPNATAWFLENLTPSSTYHFKMRAINQRGQSQDSITRSYVTLPSRNLPSTPPIPTNNILMMIVLCLILVLFVLFLIVSLLFCRSRSSSNNKAARRKGLLRIDKSNIEHDTKSGAGSLNQSSTVAGRVGTLARRPRLQQSDHGSNGKPDFWISAIDQQQAFAAANSAEIKSQMSEKSGSDINMAAMVSIQRDSPQQFTTQTAHLPEYRFTSGGNAQQHLTNAEHQLMQQIQGHYHTGNQFAGALAFDQMDNATASALMTLSKRQQQQLQKYQMQFAAGGVPTNQPPSPHQQPPPPPPLNIEQQQQQPLYGTHQQPGGAQHNLTSTRSLRVHRPILYDPVSGSFAQQDTPPNYNSHLSSMLNGVHHQLQSFNNQSNSGHAVTSGSNTLQFHNHHPHQTSTLMSRRSTNTLRSFQSSGGSGLYGQLGGQFAAPPVPPTSASGGQPHLLQNHQAVINQLNQTSYTSLPLKHVSAVRPQIMSSLEDQIEMELAEKQAEQQHQQSQQQGPPSSTQQQEQQT